ncbi:inovirus Gp2 family protein [Comamonas aquatica]|uniref:YagK/YfjJ domain-containing protein n=1 Tax=Comamonas aquatica TaxID=225991 RepID=UPI002448B1A7|nr:inovirus-type Gp2 protein [Comamonas aquatica]MDH1381307.1 inovirus Gp2 family protein [Comamonas aquatica]MDH1641396.1 inovirus Gp2 family protein [Comamonas aquatica]
MNKLDVSASSLGVITLTEDDEVPVYIRGADGLVLNSMIQNVLEWTLRTPHVYPFNIEAQKQKYKYEILVYQKSVFDLIYEVSFLIERNIDISSECSVEINPAALVVLEGTKEWLTSKNKNVSEWVMHLIFEMTYNEFRIQSDDVKFEIKKAVNCLTLYLHKRLMKAGGWKILHGFKRNSTECYKQLMQVGEQSWKQHNSILLIRLDWGEPYRVPDMRAKFASQQDYEARFKQVSTTREKMLNILRKMFKDDLVFFAWKIECAPIKGLHIHWLIGLNGAKHQDRINVPRMIAQEWDEKLGADGAYTRNQSTRQKHEEAILRVIHYSDPLLWRIMGGYADYLTKVDYLTRFRAPGKMRSFGCTKIKEITKSKKGPKRSKKMPKLDMLAVRRPLRELSDEMGWKEYKA